MQIEKGNFLPEKTAQKQRKNPVFVLNTGNSFGGVGGIRTLGRLLTVTRFPVVPVMTSSIPLRIQFAVSDSSYIIALDAQFVNREFSIFDIIF